MSKVLTIVGVSILALTLVLGITLPSLAASDKAKPPAGDSQPRVVMGKVLSVDEANQQFVVKSGDKELTISVNEDTEYYKMGVPGRIISFARRFFEFRHQNQEGMAGPANGSPNLNWLHPFEEKATFSDIEEGDRVVVWLAKDSESLLAERVEITKVTTYEHISGTITDVSAGDKTITITPEGGKAVTLTYDDSTEFILKGVIQVEVGQSAKAVYDSDTLIAKTVTVNQGEATPAD